jgi:peptide/nickel transport system permease protein
MALAEIVSRRTRLDRQFDQLRRLEEAGKLKPATGSRLVRKFLNNRLAVIGLVVFTIILVASILAPLLTPWDPTKINLRAINQPPSWEHWFGTDKTGRDVFARVLYGGRISILVGLGSALISAVVGVIIGCYAGYVGGWIDAFFMRLSEIIMAFPELILVLVLVSIVGQSLTNIMAIFIVGGWCGIYRLVRAQMLSLREEEYVQALRSFGLNRGLISFKHMLPNAMGPVMVNITLSTAAFILQEAGLSFLGLGVPLNIPTWGNILNVAQDLTVLQNSWWLWLPVGIFISLFVLSVNFIGDGLRDASDPTQQG